MFTKLMTYQKSDIRDCSFLLLDGHMQKFWEVNNHTLNHNQVTGKLIWHNMHQNFCSWVSTQGVIDKQS